MDIELLVIALGVAISTIWNFLELLEDEKCNFNLRVVFLI